jgi:hypothetical protein
MYGDPPNCPKENQKNNVDKTEYEYVLQFLSWQAKISRSYIIKK